VLVAAGCCDAQGNKTGAELYDPTTGTWTRTGSLHIGRDSHTATLLPDGRVLVVGGLNTDPPIASAEVWDPRTGMWTSTDDMHVRRVGHNALLLPTGDVIVTGGNVGNAPFGRHPTASAELYDPRTGHWRFAAFMEVARNFDDEPIATLLPTGKVLVAGGAGRTQTQASAELYTP
jgi:hypothetical protein